MRNGQRLHKKSTHNKLDVKKFLSALICRRYINQEQEKKAIAQENKLSMSKAKWKNERERGNTKKRTTRNGFFELMNRLDN